MGTVYTCQLTSDIDVYSLSVEENGKTMWKETIIWDADQVRQEYRRMLYNRAPASATKSRFYKNLKNVTAGYIHKCILCMGSSFPSARRECQFDPNV